MTLFWIGLYLPALALVLRALTSRDSAALRGTGAALAAAAVVLPMLAPYPPFDSSQALVFGAFGAAILYLLIWAAISKDLVSHRVTSIGAAVLGALPLFFLYMFATHYRE